jgi:hypothetical protein
LSALRAADLSQNPCSQTLQMSLLESERRYPSWLPRLLRADAGR